jgi:hypothetical protein
VLQEQHVVGILPIELQSLCFGFRWIRHFDLLRKPGDRRYAG